MPTGLIETIASYVPLLKRLPARIDDLDKERTRLKSLIGEMDRLLEKERALLGKERAKSAHCAEQLSLALSTQKSLRASLNKTQEKLRKLSETQVASLRSQAPLSQTAQAVLEEGLTLTSWEKLHRIESMASEAVSQQIEGDIVEFGLALGGSAIVLAKIASQAGRVFHGFDVFGMIPPPSSDKDDEKSKERYEVIASGQSKGVKGATYYGYRPNLYDEVCASFGRYGLPVDGEHVVLHKGLFEDTVPLYRSEKIAFAHIDCDWYDPVKFCLESIENRVALGGVIILDDYYTYGGCRTATHEFLARRHDYHFESGVTALLRRISE